jgi:type VI secretion system secreted protein VgrG
MSRLSKNRFDEFQSNAEEGNGYGDYRCLTAGKMFKPVEAQSRSLNIDWLCTSVHYEGTEHEQVDTDSAGMGAGGVSYRMSFTCIPKSLPYRPPCRTPMPRILGTQTAVVVGPAGEEIHTDKFGRVKIHLHWDRQPKTDKNANEDDINYNDA